MDGPKGADFSRLRRGCPLGRFAIVLGKKQKLSTQKGGALKKCPLRGPDVGLFEVAERFFVQAKHLALWANFILRWLTGRLRGVPVGHVPWILRSLLIG